MWRNGNGIGERRKEDMRKGEKDNNKLKDKKKEEDGKKGRETKNVPQGCNIVATDCRFASPQKNNKDREEKSK